MVTRCLENYVRNTRIWKIFNNYLKLLYYTAKYYFKITVILNKMKIHRD
jgi:hypothetical protein